MYLACDVASKEVVWDYKIRQQGGQVMFPKQESSLPANTVLRTCMGIYVV